MIEMKMRAAVLENYCEPLVLRDVPRPQPGPKEVVVRVRACGVCGSDLLLRSGGFKSVLPIIPGHELSGEIVTTGSQVQRFHSGDRVLVYIYVHCGECFFCRSGQPNICTSVKRIGVDWNGGFAEYVLVPEVNLLPLPADVGFLEGAVLTDSVATPYHALRRIALLNAGETVVVLGIGGVGSNAIQVARWLGARVIAISRNLKKLELATRLGAEILISIEEDDISTRVRSVTNGLGADICIQCVGHPAMDELAIALARSGGRVVLVGASREPFRVTSTDFIWKELRVMGSRGFTPEDIVAVVNAYRERKLSLEHLLQSVFTLESANKALDLLAAGATQRTVLVPNSEG